MLSFLVSQDIALLNYLRSFIDPNSVLQVRLIHIGSDIEVALVMFVLVGLWLYGAYQKNDQSKIDALMMLYSIGFAFAVYVVLNLGLPFRPRPETVSTIRPLVDHLPDNSFPSGHAIFFGASVLAAFYYTRSWIAWTLLITGVLMVLSRVLAGIHYPGDILVGTIIGLVGSYIVYRLRDTKCVKGYLLVYPVKMAKLFRL
ncbi:MAG: phosphatase PAP2 family protein [Candidatus Gracilibacteria bacterium]|nr:phosphatase PAP2 family protein [Candidatus Gracilibacteria bacterium]